MSVSIAAVAFNDPGGDAADAVVNLRWNASRAMALPEWSVNTETEQNESVACYAIGRLTRSTVTIHVTLQSSDGVERRGDVRALATVLPDTPPWWPCAPSPLDAWRSFTGVTTSTNALSTNPLGAVDP